MQGKRRRNARQIRESFLRNYSACKLSEDLSTEKLQKASLKDQYDEISRRYDSIKDENRYLRSTLEFSKNEAIDLHKFANAIKTVGNEELENTLADEMLNADRNKSESEESSPEDFQE